MALATVLGLLAVFFWVLAVLCLVLPKMDAETTAKAFMLAIVVSIIAAIVMDGTSITPLVNGDTAKLQFIQQTGVANVQVDAGKSQTVFEVTVDGVKKVGICIPGNPPKCRLYIPDSKTAQ